MTRFFDSHAPPYLFALRTESKTKMNGQRPGSSVTILVLIRQHGTWPSGDVPLLVKPNYFDNHTIFDKRLSQTWMNENVEPITISEL
jgi:hypothetical protein